MADAIHLIMPMAGRGSRFRSHGFSMPKPLIPLRGVPFFVWAVDGVRRVLPDCVITFVVLEEHARDFDMAGIICKQYPSANIVTLDHVTQGALETACLGLGAAGDGPVIVNDCDHYFRFARLAEAVDGLQRGAYTGFLSHFPSRSPQFSFARYDDDGYLVETAEKVVISDLAIAGVYGFASSEMILAAFDSYRGHCPYDELYVSGLYNELVRDGCHRVTGFPLDFHVPFGTPEEYELALHRGELLGGPGGG